MSIPQPVPPSWKDLGKSSNDLLSKDYPIGSTSLEVKTTTPNNVLFRVQGDDAKGVIGGITEAKYTDRKNGVVFTQGWTTANKLNTSVELENNFVQGLKLDLQSSLNPAEVLGEKSQGRVDKSTILNAVYKQAGLHSRASLNVFKGPTFTADTVFGHDGFLIGAEAAYNVTSGTVTNYGAALGFSAPDYAVTFLAQDNLNRYTASYYHRVSRDVEAGGKAVYDAGRPADGVKLEVGTKAFLDGAANVKAKINNVGLLSLSYQQSLRPGVKASFGLSLDTQKLGGGPVPSSAHKVGASFVFEG